MSFTKKKNYKIEGWAIYERNPIDFSNEKPHYMDSEWGLTVEETDFIKWVRNRWDWLPDDKKGVYIIYSETGEPLYIGSTGNKKGFRGRLSKHHNKELFGLKAEHIKMYYIEDPTARLLFERIKIHQLEPILNRDFQHSLKVTDNYLGNLKNEILDAMSELKVLGEQEQDIKDLLDKEGFKGLVNKITELKGNTP